VPCRPAVLVGDGRYGGWTGAHGRVHGGVYTMMGAQQLIRSDDPIQISRILNPGIYGSRTRSYGSGTRSYGSGTRSYGSGTWGYGSGTRATDLGLGATDPGLGYQGL